MSHFQGKPSLLVPNPKAESENPQMEKVWKAFVHLWTDFLCLMSPPNTERDSRYISKSSTPHPLQLHDTITPLHLNKPASLLTFWMRWNRLLLAAFLGVPQVWDSHPWLGSKCAKGFPSGRNGSGKELINHSIGIDS